MVLIIIISVLFTFTYPLIVDRRLSGLDAVKLSAKAALANFWNLLGLLFLTKLARVRGRAAVLRWHVPRVSDHLFGHVRRLQAGVWHFRSRAGSPRSPPPPTFT